MPAHSRPSAVWPMLPGHALPPPRRRSASFFSLSPLRAHPPRPSHRARRPGLGAPRPRVSVSPRAPSQQIQPSPPRGEARHPSLRQSRLATGRLRQPRLATGRLRQPETPARPGKTAATTRRPCVVLKRVKRNTKSTPALGTPTASPSRDTNPGSPPVSTAATQARHLKISGSDDKTQKPFIGPLSS